MKSLTTVPSMSALPILPALPPLPGLGLLPPIPGLPSLPLPLLSQPHDQENRFPMPSGPPSTSAPPTSAPPTSAPPTSATPATSSSSAANSALESTASEHVRQAASLAIQAPMASVSTMQTLAAAGLQSFGDMSRSPYRCTVCNYETLVARNLRIHMTR